MGHWKQEPQSLMPTSDPTERDILYFAGFYEGEGSVRGAANGSCTVQVPQKDPEALFRARSLWGGSIRVNGRGISVWVMSGDRARKFLIAIYPYMTGRRKKQIEDAGALVLTGKKSLEVGGIDPQRMAARSSMTPEERHRETCNQWASKNKERHSAYQRQWAKENREHLNELQRERRRRIREEKMYITSNSIEAPNGEGGSKLVN